MAQAVRVQVPPRVLSGNQPESRMDTRFQSGWVFHFRPRFEIRQRFGNCRRWLAVLRSAARRDALGSVLTGALRYGRRFARLV